MLFRLIGNLGGIVGNPVFIGRLETTALDFLRHGSDVQCLTADTVLESNIAAGRNGGPPRRAGKSAAADQGISRSPMRQWRVRPLPGLLGKGHCFSEFIGHRSHALENPAGRRPTLPIPTRSITPAPKIPDEPIMPAWLMSIVYSPSLGEM